MTQLSIHRLDAMLASVIDLSYQRASMIVPVWSGFFILSGLLM
jgi:hypothetical protein